MQVQSDDRQTALAQRAQVTEGLGELQAAQREGLSWHLHVTLYRTGDLQEDSRTRTAFMVLASRVQDAGCPAKCHRGRGRGGQRVAQPGCRAVSHRSEEHTS